MAAITGNIYPSVITPVVNIARYRDYILNGVNATWTNISTVTGLRAEVLTMEQRSGAANDQAWIRLPAKRLEYFNHADSDWALSNFDGCMISMSGKVQAMGTTRNWVRRWQGNSETVEFNVISMDRVHNGRGHGKSYGKYNFATGTIYSGTKSTVPTSKLIFNERGYPDFNRADTASSNLVGFTVGGPRFWGGGSPYDSTGGYWNPLWMLIYLRQQVYPLAHTPFYHYSVLNQAFGSVSSTGGWSGTTSFGDLKADVAFPEVDVDGLTYGEAVEKVLDEVGGGFKVYMRPDESTGELNHRFYRTYPPYASQQTVKDLGLASVSSTQPITANNLQRGRVTSDYARMATHVIALGANDRFIGTVKMHPGWDSTLTEDVFSTPDLIDITKPSYNPKYQDVMRRWIVPRSTHDLNSLFGVTIGNTGWGEPAPFSNRTHNFMPSMGVRYNTKATGEDSPAALKPLVAFVSYGGSTAYKAAGNVRLIDDELGFFVDGPAQNLTNKYFIANTLGANGGTINNIYMTAAIEADSRLWASVKDAKITASSTPDIQYITKNESFRWEDRALSMGDYSVGGNRRILLQVPGVSGLVATTMGTFRQVNDSTGLSTLAKDTYNFRNTVLDVAEVTIPWIEDDYEIGTIIGSIHDRNIVLNSVVVGRLWDFEPQTTTLYVTDDRFRG